MNLTTKDAGIVQRAYSTLEIKSVDEDQRVIEGMATSPAADRVGDIVEPGGAVFKLPVPLLWHHDAKQPIGQVLSAKITNAGIAIVAQLAGVTDPGALKTRVDEAWHSIKAGLVRGLSIGFRSIDGEPIQETGGTRFTRWEWLELSAVTIPANAEASIQVIKEIDNLTRKSDAPKASQLSPPQPVVARELTKAEALDELDREFNSAENIATGRMKVAEWKRRREEILSRPDPDPVPEVKQVIAAPDYVTKTYLNSCLGIVAEALGNKFRENEKLLLDRIDELEKRQWELALHGGSKARDDR